MRIWCGGAIEEGGPQPPSTVQRGLSHLSFLGNVDI